MKIYFHITTVFVVMAFTGCQNDRPQELQTTSLDEFGKEFVKAVAVGDIDGIDRMYITPKEFRTTFSGKDLDTLYESSHETFYASLTKTLPSLKGVQFVRMNMEYCPEPISTRPGMNFGVADFRGETLATDNIRVIVKVGEEEREIKLDALIKVGARWRLLSPIELLPAH